MNTPRTKIIALCAAFLLACGACSKKPAENSAEKSSNSSAVQAVNVNVTQATSSTVDIVENTVGSIEGLVDPTVVAEISGKVLAMNVKPGQRVKKGEVIARIDNTDYALQRNEAAAEVGRVKALIANQQKNVQRNQTLVQKNFISKAALDDSTSQLKALQQQLAGANARVATISHSAGKANVLATQDGIIEKQIVSAGDFVAAGSPVAQIVGERKLRAHLPFPEQTASQIRPGQSVALTTPASSETITAVVNELKPMVDTKSRAIDVMVDFTGQPGWQPGASVNASVTLGQRAGAVMVPEQSVVLRPAGAVVYSVQDNNTVKQTVVKTGLHKEGKVEILEGLANGARIVVDGAGFLTDGAKVSVNAASGDAMASSASDAAPAVSAE